MVGIKDVAQRAGVSPTTVSNVLHGKTKRVSQEKIDRINQIIKEMHYVPSLNARALAGTPSRLIGLVTSREYMENQPSTMDPFMGALIGYLQMEIRSRGYNFQQVDAENHQEVLNDAISWNFDGLLMIGMFADEELAALRKKYDKPMVAYDTYGIVTQELPHIMTDDYGGMYRIGEYLLERGHRHVLYVSNNDVNVNHIRWLGFRAAMEAAGLDDLDNRHMLISRNRETRLQQYRVMLPLFRQYTALAFSSDVYATDAINVLMDNGVRVPEDVSVTGFDDIVYATIVRPKLTTVHQPIELKAKMAAEALIAQIKGLEPKTDVIVPTTIVERDSVLDLRKRE